MKRWLSGMLVLALSAAVSAQTAGDTATTTAKKKHAAKKTSKADDIQALRQMMEQQQQQIQQLQQDVHERDSALQQLQQQVQQTQSTATEAATKADQAQAEQKETSSKVQNDLADVRSTLTNNALNLQEEQKSKESPLSFRIGKVDFTPAGFLDLSNVWRSTNTGGPTGTGFNSIPFNNTIQGHLTEYRFSGQHSRVNLKAHAMWGENEITGFIEADFNGNDAASVFTSTNGHTNRLRHYFVDIKHHKFEFLAGQTWGWLVPNKTGASTDAWVTAVWDPNYNVGLTLTRAAQLRFVYHPTNHWSLGVGIENPDQYVGAGETIYPFAFNAALGPQFSANNQTSTPNLHPDLMAKVAYDAKPGGHAVHFEVAGLATSMKLTHVPIGGTTFVGQSATGGGIQGSTNIELIKKHLTFYATAFYSDGGGRYVFGLGPDTVVRPIQTGPTTFTIEPTLVHSTSGLLGFEAQITPRNLLYAYYGGAFFERNTFGDVTSPIIQAPHPCAFGGPLTTKPCIGFGGFNSPNSANRAIQEPTFGWTYTMWKDANYGAMAFLTQYSYVTRSPWFVPTGAPKNAHLSMVFVTLRYTLP